MEGFYSSFSNREPVPLANYPGVYFLCQGDEIVYVGQSRNIACRIAEHVGKKDFDTVMALRVGLEELNCVERYWIARLGPRFNGQVLKAQRKRRDGLESSRH